VQVGQHVVEGHHPLGALGGALLLGTVVQQPAQQAQARQLQRLMPEDAPILLITLDYAAAEMQGPPFATPLSRIQELYADRYDIHLLEELDALDDNPALRNRGLTWLKEAAWHLAPR
jgi:hypothetical protein